ncbi:MAG: AbrB/MazE/SpoVT family DNA-binding domain-containing protein [Candidatus Chisholmbacteria bacterium]|nr:AbrB/MazE/SpoVT family DNA-binding domain-containing protein [Candidatus Chisholmbacteria bacterium]
MLQKVIRVGNSRGVTIPADFVKAVGVKVGDQVKSVSYPETGRVVYTFSGVKQLLISSDFSGK